MSDSPRRPTTATALALGLLLMATAAAGQYQVIGTNSSQLEGGVTKTEIAVAAGPNPIDQFRITRLVKEHVPTEHLRGVIFFLPSLGIDFTSYEQRTPRRDLGSSIAGFFALRNFDVWGYSSRLEGLSAGGCEAGVYDCSPMAGWDMESLVADVAFARAQIEAHHPGAEVWVGGLSLGGIATIAVLDDAPNDYAGAFIWEGMLASPDPQIQALNQGYCAGVEAQLAAGLLYDGVGGNIFKKVTRLALINPEGAARVPLFPPFLTNQQAMVSFVSTPTPGPVSMPTPGYILLNGNAAQGELFFADLERLVDNVARFNDYVPLALVRDISCSLAGVETQFVDDLGDFTGPILGIGGGFGFGPYMQGNLALFGSTDVELLLEPDFGHADHLLTADHRRFVERPIYDWIRRHSSP